jgi:hypothetical protein
VHDPVTGHALPFDKAANEDGHSGGLPAHDGSGGVTCQA